MSRPKIRELGARGLKYRMGAISVARGRWVGQRPGSMNSPDVYRVPDAEVARVVHVGHHGGALEATSDRRAEGELSPYCALEVRIRDDLRRKLEDRSRCA